MVFENKVLRKYLDLRGINKLRRMRLAGHVMYISAMRNVYKILVGKPER
jgi:hypothetical protein